MKPEAAARPRSSWLAGATEFLDTPLRDLQRLASHPGVHGGIKLALSGTLSLHVALLINLDQPGWAVTTSFVLCTVRYVGAIVEKAFLRIGGALCGALLGFLITVSMVQTPVLLLITIGTLVAVTTALYGGTPAPYGFRQCGYTATLVVSQGVAHPEMAWSIGVARCEEICVGIVVTTIVTVIFWPRYARVEFQEQVRSILSDMATRFRERSTAFVKGEAAGRSHLLLRLGAKLATLRKTIHAGVQESSHFLKKEPQVNAIVSQISAIGTAVSTIGKTLPLDSHFRPFVEDEIHGINEAMLGLMGSVAQKEFSASRVEAGIARLDELLRLYEAKLRQMRELDAGRRIPAEESFEHGAYALSVLELRDALKALAPLLENLQSDRGDGFPFIVFQKYRAPSIEWIHNGIRSGLVVVAGLVLARGMEVVVVGGYLFTALSLDSADRRGDAKVFSHLLRVAGVSLVMFLFLLCATPWMASYAVQNLILASTLFLAGYLPEKRRISYFASLFLLLASSSLVDLNAQEPVEFGKIAATVGGLLGAAALAAVVRRFCWPSLPQHELRKRLVAITKEISEAGRGHFQPMSPAAESGLFLAPAHAIELIGVNTELMLSKDEAGRLELYTRCLFRAAQHTISVCKGEDLRLPESLRAEFSERLRELGGFVSGVMERQMTAIQTGRVPGAATASEEEWMESFIAWAAEGRRRIKAEHVPVMQSILEFGFFYRCEQLAREVLESLRIARTLDLREDFADRYL